MSGSKEKDQTPHPDDTDRRLEELMADLRRSEQEVLGITPPAEEEDSGEETFDPDEDFLSDEESDYVDLDAELLDNTTDKLELDVEDILVDEEQETVQEDAATEDQQSKDVLPEIESQEEENREEEVRDESAEEELLDELMAAFEQAAESDAEAAAQEGGEEQQHVTAEDELARARLDELEVRLATLEAFPLEVPSPPERVTEGGPGRLSAILALLALVVSGAALWFAFGTGAAPVTGNATMELDGLKSDVAALRKRLNDLEKQASLDNQEAMETLQRMQALLSDMEKKFPERGMSAPGASVSEEIVESVGDAPPLLDEPVDQPKGATASQVAPVDVEENTPPAKQQANSSTPSSGKVFVKGWAVNLQSYVHRLDAERMMQRYQKAGVDAEIREIPKGDSTWYRVRVMGFKSKEEADTFIRSLTVEQGRDEAWPSYYQGYIDK